MEIAKKIILLLVLLVYQTIYGYSQKDSISFSSKELIQIHSKLDKIVEKVIAVKRGHFETYGPLYVGLLAVLGALYAAYRQYLNTKGQAVANFRMKWIEDYRKLCAELQVSLDNIAYKAMDGHLKNPKKTYFAEDPDFLTARRAYHTLRLMLNTNKDENEKYLDLISKYIDNHIKYYNFDKDAPAIEKLTELKKEFLFLSEKKLNKAWEKAKNLE